MRKITILLCLQALLFLVSCGGKSNNSGLTDPTFDTYVLEEYVCGYNQGCQVLQVYEGVNTFEIICRINIRNVGDYQPTHVYKTSNGWSNEWACNGR